MSSAPLLSPRPLDTTHIEIVAPVSWDEYGRYLEERDRRGDRFPRMYFVDGVLSLVSPGRSHERVKRMVEFLIDAWSIHADVVLEGTGSTTERGDGVGAEPDSSYQVGPARDDERPDFVIEVVHTASLTLGRLETYRRLAVAEVWSVQVDALDRLREGDASARPLQVLLHRLDYQENATRTSEVLPSLDVSRLSRALAAGLNEGRRAGLAVVAPS